jgi:hypothetical protein
MTRDNREQSARPALTGFRLLPNIIFTRQPLPDGIAYVFRDVDLRELGALAVESTPGGETLIVSEVAGDARIGVPIVERSLTILILS